MTDFIPSSSLGERVKLLRKARGIKSTNELADLTGGAVSAWTLQNLESGRKPDINISSLLNLAMALKVAPTFLLAPMSRPGARLDIPHLIDEFTNMTVAEFDAWFSGLPEGAIATSGADRNERQELQALRELSTLVREKRRLEIMATLEKDAGDLDPSDRSLANNTVRRIAEADRHILELTHFLTKAGWEIEGWADSLA
ncbi:MAG: helix-turn-helix domain-containing protein [Rhodoglobus sp.]